MPVRAEGEQPAPRPAVARINIPAQAAPDGDGFPGLHAGHELDCFRLQDADTVEFAEVKEHAGVTGKIRRCEKETGVARNTSHVPRGRVVYDPSPGFALDHFRWGNAGHLRFGWQIPGVRHLQWFVNLTGDKCFERLLADALNDFTEEEEIDVTVAEGRAGCAQ